MKLCKHLPLRNLLAQTEICLISRHSCCFTLGQEKVRERKGKGTRQVLVHPSWLLPHQHELPHEQEDGQSRETARRGVSRSGGGGGVSRSGGGAMVVASEWLAKRKADDEEDDRNEVCVCAALSY